MQGEMVWIVVSFRFNFNRYDGRTDGVKERVPVYLL